jgi:hypothetical protein
MKPTRTISSYLLLVGVMGLSIVGGIVAYQIYAAAVKSQTTVEQKEAIKPLDGVLNQKTIEGLQKRTVYTDGEMGLILATTPTPELTPELTITPTITTAPTPTVTPTPVASGSATTQ